MNIYLCGGFKTGWQDYVIKEVKKYDFENEIVMFDPRNNNFPGIEAIEYFEADMTMISESDILFAHIENENPFAGGLVEIGIAYGLEIPIYIVKEPGKHLIHKEHHLEFAYQCAFEGVSNGLVEGVEKLTNNLALCRHTKLA